MKTIAVFLNVRKNSSRLPNKLLLDFAGTSLFEICLDKLDKIKADERYLCAYDEEFFLFDHSRDIQNIKRSIESVSVDGPLTKVFEFFNLFSSDYVMFLNPCHAHIKVETIQSAIDFFKNSDFESMTSVVKERNWFFDKNGYLLYPKNLEHGDTKKTDECYRVAHAFHIYNRKRFLENDGFLWSWKKDDPHLFQIPVLESIDVDTYEEFLISKSLYENRNSM